MSSIFKKTVISLLIAGVTGGLVGCNTTMINKTQKDISETHSVAKSELGAYGSPELNLVSVKDRVFIGAEEIRVEEVENLPAVFSERVEVTSTSLSLYSLVELVKRETGLNISIGSDAQAFMSLDNGGSSGGSDDGAQVLAQALQAGQQPPMSTESSSDDDSASAGRSVSGSRDGGIADIMGEDKIISFPLAYRGSLENMLDTVCDQLSLSWRYIDGEVEIFRHRTESFVFNALPGVSSFDTSVSNAQSATGSSEGGSTGSANTSHSTSYTGSMQAWENVAGAIEHMISFDGKYVVQESLGRITVTDTPKVIARIRDYMEKMNASVSQKVMVQAKIFEVSLTEGSEYGLDWDAVFSKSAKLGLELASGISSAPANLTATILQPSSSFVDSSIMARALSDQGNVRLVTTASVVTTNGQPAPLQVTNETSYLKSSSITTSDSGTSVELEPGTVSDGFSMNLIPKVQENGDLMLQYSIDMRSLNDIDVISSAGTSIQLPTISTQNFVQRVTIRSGNTLMLAGFERMRDKNSSETIAPGVSTILFGGNRSAAQERRVTVILLTPYVMGR